jgi:DNA repair protein SbcC/Rad50
MRPIHLTFSGLRSYRQEATIDFTDLNLVGIIGDTGAGKSTIIEALSFALYAKKTWEGGGTVERLHTKTVNTMRIEFKFHIDGHDWIVTRARSQNSTLPIDKLTSPTRGGPDVDGAQPVTDRIKKLLGLDHKQFLSVIVLPQGRFDTLLTASKPDRDKILTSILGLDEIVSTREAIAAVRSEWEPRTQSFRAQRNQFPPQPAVNLAQAHAAVRTKTIEHQTLQEAIVVGAALETTREKVRQAGTNLGKAIESLPPSDEDAPLRLTECAQLEEKLNDERIAAAETEKQSADLAHKFQSTYNELIGEVTVSQMIEAKTQLISVADRYAADSDAATEAITAHEALLDQIPSQVVDAEIVSEEASTRATLQGAESTVEAAKRAVENGRSAWAKSETVRGQLATTKNQIVQLTADVDAARTSADSAVDAQAQAASKVDKCIEALQHSKVLNAVAEIAAQCVAGDDCPICEQTIPATFTPPAQAKADDLDIDIKNAKQTLKECESKSKDVTRILNETETNLSRAKQDLATFTEEAAKASETASNIGIDISAKDEASAIQTLTITHARSVAEFESAKAIANNSQIALNQAQAAIAHQHQTYNDRLAIAARQATETGKRVHAHKKMLNGLPAALRPESTDTESIMEKASQIERTLSNAAEVDQQLVDAKKAVASAQIALAGISTRIATEVTAPSDRIISALNNRNVRVQELCTTIREADETATIVAPDGLDPLDNAFDLATKAVELTSQHQNVEAFATNLRTQLRQQFADNESAIAKLNAELQCTNFDELRAKSGSIKTELQHATANVLKLEADVVVTTSLDRYLTIAEPFIANLTILGEALKEKQFIGYLVKTRENQLLSEATRRLKWITNRRFGFGEDFTIVDIASGEARTPDTLSGGERFQAALALALALVEITTRGGGNLNAIFIDEGFGSLDANALDGALGTLNKIAGSGKLVALISHLTQVADNVDQVIRVTKTDTHGSQIEHLDPEAIERLLADDTRNGLTG